MNVSEGYDLLKHRLGGNKISAFIYNPYHYIVLYSLQLEGIHIDTLAISKTLSKSVSELPKLNVRRTVVLRDGYKSDALWSRIFAFPVNLFLFLGVTGIYPLVSANDRSILVSLWSRVGRDRRVPVLDEGALAQILFREKEDSGGKTRRWVDRFLGRYERLQNPKTNFVLSEDPRLKEEVPLLPIININCMVEKALHQLAEINRFEIKGFKSSLLLVTSPLTENGNVGSESELIIIKRVLLNNPGIDFYWSRHYRESAQKYDSLFAEFNNLRRLPNIFESLPGQIYSHLFIGLVGFHSSLLLQAARGNTRVYSLSQLVDSAHAAAFVKSNPVGVNFVKAPQIPIR